MVYCSYDGCLVPRHNILDSSAEVGLNIQGMSSATRAAAVCASPRVCRGLIAGSQERPVMVDKILPGPETASDVLDLPCPGPVPAGGDHFCDGHL